jgi:hypothetical protein
MRHAASITISPELVVAVMTEGYKSPFKLRCGDGIPPGSSLTNAFINNNDDLELHFEHPDLPAVLEGEVMPRRTPHFELVEP